VKPNLKLTLTLLAGIALGLAIAHTIHAQQPKTPPAYVVAEVEVSDPAGMQKYGAQVPATLAPFNHHYVIRSGKFQPLEGDAPKGGLVVIAFDSADQAQAWWDSPAYDAIKPIRQSAAKSRIFIVEGVAPPVIGRAGRVAPQ
jgi:uncharacterized protein (DUF1330 family)